LAQTPFRRLHLDVKWSSFRGKGPTFHFDKSSISSTYDNRVTNLFT